MTMPTGGMFDRNQPAAAHGNRHRVAGSGGRNDLREPRAWHFEVV